MAKRGIDEHPKTIDFADALGIAVCYAVGPLELFWHWVAKYRPTGDLTGIKPTAVAHSIRFPGDAAALWHALQTAGLIDIRADGTTIVHDWSEHADNSVHQLLKKRGERFADGHEPFTRNRKQNHDQTKIESEPFTNDSQTVHERFTNRSRLPEPEPEPEPEPVNPPISPLPGDEIPQNQRGASPEVKPPRSKPSSKAEPEWFAEWWDEFCGAYPPRSGDAKKTEGRKVALSLVAGDRPLAESVLAGVQRYRVWCQATGKVSTEYVQTMPPWLRGERWKDDWEPPYEPPGDSHRDAERAAMLEAVGL